MLYVLSGKGSVPPKEISTVLGQLLANAERQAAEAGLEEVDFWLALDPDLISGDDPCWRALDRWATEEGVYVAAADDLRQVIAGTIGSGEPVAVLAVPSSPEFTGEGDDDLLSLMSWATTDVKFYDLSGQMYEIALSDDAPSSNGTGQLSPEAMEGVLADLVGGGHILMDEEERIWPIYSRHELEAKGRDELKDIARNMGLIPRDWRSKDSIIDSVLAHQSSFTESDTPMKDETEEFVDNSVPDVPENQTTAATEPDTGDDITAMVRQLVRQELRVVLLDALSRITD